MKISGIFQTLILVVGFSATALSQQTTAFFQEIHAADATDEYTMNSVDALVRFWFIKLPAPLATEEKLVEIDLPSGKILRAALYSNGTVGKLALVRCGIFCAGERSDISSLASETFMGSLGYSHVLVIGSTSGSDYWQDNQSIDIGGYAEARETDDLLTNLGGLVPELDGKVDHITLVGASLGGHTVLTFGLLQSRGLIHSGGVSEIIALSPVVDLRRSFDRLFDGDWVSDIAQTKIAEQLEDSSDDVPLLKSISDQYLRLKTRQERHDFLWQQLSLHQPSPDWTQYIDLTPMVGDIAIPTLILQADDDFVVHADDNAKRIVFGHDNSPLAVEYSKYGSHCAFTQVYPDTFFVDGVSRFLSSIPGN